MEFPVITNFNFDDFVTFTLPKPKNCPQRECQINKVNDEIYFETNFVACPCIYYVKQGELFAFSFDVDSVVKFALDNGIELTDTFDNLNQINGNIRAHIKTSVLKNYKYNVNYIENWCKVLLKRNGEFVVKENSDNDWFTIDVRNNPQYLQKFIDKFRLYVNNLIDEKLFIPSITGGLDTRFLTGLFRGREKDIDRYYLKGVKPDGKSNIEKGRKEMEIAEMVVSKLGIKGERVEKLDGCYTVSGMFNENCNEYNNPNDPQYIYKIIQHSYSNKNNYGNKILPFISDDYLRIKQDGEFMRVLLELILRPELIFIPLVSGTYLFNLYPNGYSFTQIEKINSVATLLNKWKKEGIEIC